jgi:hypothetical protein
MAQPSNWSWRLSDILRPLYIPWLLPATALLVVMAFLLAYYPRQERSKAPVAVESGTVILCMDRYGTKKDLQITDLQLVMGIYQICYNVVSTSLLAQEQAIRNENFVFQRSENIVLMYMVVVITVSGVILAGLQLLASYKLAVSGKGSFPDGEELNINWNSMALKSSVVGVVILGISFAFFLVFVLYVYTLKDDRIGGSPSSSQSVQISSPRQLQQTTPPEQANIGKAVPRQPSPSVAPD